MTPMPAVPMPLTLGDFRRACRSTQARLRLEEDVAHRHEAEAAFGVSSARAALWLMLRALRRLRPERDLVVVPAYTCPTVGRAVVEAGLRVLCVDVSPDSLNLDAAAVKEALGDRVLAVVAAHMFGVPCDLAALRASSEAHGAWLIEDCAQCLGGSRAGRPVGTVGDLSFLSMGRSKNLRGCEGGLLWTRRPELVAPLRAQFEALPEPPVRDDRARQAVIIGLSQPHLWALAKRLPGMKVGAEDPSFDPLPSKLAHWRAAVGLVSLARLEEHNGHRRTLATDLRCALRGIEAIQCQAVPSDAEATFPRFAALLGEGLAHRRDELVRRLQGANVDARGFYSAPMTDYPWARCVANAPDPATARRIVRSNLILPLPHFADEMMMQRVADRVARALEEMR